MYSCDGGVTCTGLEGTSLRMKRWIDASEKKKVKANPEVTKMWGTEAGSSFCYIILSIWVFLTMSDARILI